MQGSTIKPLRLSASFNGRDLFAPVAAMLAAGQVMPEMVGVVTPFACQGWPDDLARIIYVDRYGNLITGIRAGSLAVEAVIVINGPSDCRTHAPSQATAQLWGDGNDTTIAGNGLSCSRS